MMDYFLIFLVLLAVMTIVGHLLWRLIAMMFGYRVQTIRRDAPRTRSTARSSDDLQAQLDRLVEFRLIDPATRERVLAAVHVQRRIDTGQPVLGRSPMSGPPPLPAIPLQAPAMPPPLPPSTAVAAGAVTENATATESLEPKPAPEPF